MQTQYTHTHTRRHTQTHRNTNTTQRHTDTDTDTNTHTRNHVVTISEGNWSHLKVYKETLRYAVRSLLILYTIILYSSMEYLMLSRSSMNIINSCSYYILHNKTCHTYNRESLYSFQTFGEEKSAK